MVQKHRGTHVFDKILVKGVGAFSKPTPLGELADYYEDFEDFLRPTADLTDWTVTEVGAGGTELYPDEVGGVLLLTTDALDNDAVQVQRKGETYLLAATKPLWFECRTKVTKVTESDLFWGLSDTDTTLLPDPATSDGVYFCKDDGDALIDIVTMVGSAATKASSGVELVTGTWTKLAFYWDGATVFFYIDDVYVGSTALHITATELCVSFGIWNGEGGATPMRIDYYRVMQKR